MRVAVWEYCTATGFGAHPDHPAHRLWQLGRSMRDALTADFAAMPNVQAWGSPASSAPWQEQLHTLSYAADWIVPIAPEQNGLLAEVVARLTPGTARCLACSLASIQLTSDKFRFAQHLEQAGIATPRTWLVSHRPESLGYPCVVKPRDGAGSFATFRLDSASDWPVVLAQAAAVGVDLTTGIVQPWIAGVGVSVAFLCGPSGNWPIATTEMRIGPRLEYLGGVSPAAARLEPRAITLAKAALSTVAGLCGFVGVDLLVGETGCAEKDFVLEVNPRVCASYPGLRQRAKGNLAAEMLKIVANHEPAWIAWSPDRVSW